MNANLCANFIRNQQEIIKIIQYPETRDSGSVESEISFFNKKYLFI